MEKETMGAGEDAGGGGDDYGDECEKEKYINER